MRVGILGTGAIANKHAQAYERIGFQVAACANRSETKGRAFAETWGAAFVSSAEELCRFPGLDYIDVCTFPDSHLEPVRICAQIRRPVLLQKPIAVDLTDAGAIVETARSAGIVLGVVSQHRFDNSTIFLKRAIAAGRLGRILQADAYVKWFRSTEYYARPGKGRWAVEGGGALINQAIHQADVLLYLAGPVNAVQGAWQLGARHAIESEDIVNALLHYQSGATGVLQAATAFWPGYPERIEIHGTNGTAIVSGDRLTRWDVDNDAGANRSDPAPIASDVSSGSSDPMAIDLTPFERQFQDFAEAIRQRREPLTSAADGYRALALVQGIYEACRTGALVQLSS